MSILSRFNGSANQIIRIGLADSSTGAPKTGQTNTATGLIISTLADGEASPTVYTAAGSTIDGTIATLGTYQAPASNHCRFKEIDATNHPGLYEIHLAQTRFAVVGAGYLDVSVQAPGSNIALSNQRYDLGNQVDVRAFGGTAGIFAAGRPEVNTTHLGGSASRVTKFGLEMDVRATGTVTNATFSPTTTQFECSDITDSAGFVVYTNRGFVITSGALVKVMGTILGDAVGTSGRRFTVAALPSTVANGDTILIG